MNRHLKKFGAWLVIGALLLPFIQIIGQQAFANGKGDNVIGVSAIKQLPNWCWITSTQMMLRTFLIEHGKLDADEYIHEKYGDKCLNAVKNYYQGSSINKTMDEFNQLYKDNVFGNSQSWNLYKELTDIDKETAFLVYLTSGKLNKTTERDIFSINLGEEMLLAADTVLQAADMGDEYRCYKLSGVKDNRREIQEMIFNYAISNKSPIVSGVPGHFRIISGINMEEDKLLVQETSGGGPKWYDRAKIIPNEQGWYFIGNKNDIGKANIEQDNNMANLLYGISEVGESKKIIIAINQEDKSYHYYIKNKDDQKKPLEKLYQTNKVSLIYLNHAEETYQGSLDVDVSYGGAPMGWGNKAFDMYQVDNAEGLTIDDIKQDWTLCKDNKKFAIVYLSAGYNKIGLDQDDRFYHVDYVDLSNGDQTQLNIDGDIFGQYVPDLKFTGWFTDSGKAGINIEDIKQQLQDMKLKFNVADLKAIYGSDVIEDNKEPLIKDNTMTLYAKWGKRDSDKSAQVVYHKNDGSADQYIDVVNEDKMTGYKIKGIESTVKGREGYTFVSWSDNAEDGELYGIDQILNLTKNQQLNLYAIWLKNDDSNNDNNDNNSNDDNNGNSDNNDNSDSGFEFVDNTSSTSNGGGSGSSSGSSSSPVSGNDLPAKNETTISSSTSLSNAIPATVVPIVIVYEYRADETKPISAVQAIKNNILPLIDLTNISEKTDKAIVFRTNNYGESGKKENQAIWTFELSKLNKKFAENYEKAERLEAKASNNTITQQESKELKEAKLLLNDYNFKLSVKMPNLEQSNTLPEKAKEVFKNKNAILVDFMENGQFPGEAVVDVNLGMDKANKEYIVYYVYKDENTGKTVTKLISKDLKVNKNGYVRFRADHGADYVFLPKTAENMLNAEQIELAFDKAFSNQN